MVVLLQTFVIFPGVVIDQQYVIFEEGSIWKAITLVTIHNVMDTIGRTMALKQPISFATNWYLTCIRTFQCLFFMGSVFLFSSFCKSWYMDII